MGVGFQHGQAPSFAMGRIDGQPGRGEQLVPLPVLHVAMPAHNVVAETEPGRVPAEAFPVRSVADQVDDQPGVGRAKRGKGVQQQMQSFVRDEPAHADDGRPVSGPVHPVIPGRIDTAGHDETRPAQPQDLPRFVPRRG